MTEFRTYGLELRTRYAGRPLSAFLRRKEPVGGDGYDKGLCLDSRQGCVHSAPCAAEVVAVQLVTEAQVAVGIEPAGHELVSLMALVGGGAARKPPIYAKR